MRTKLYVDQSSNMRFSELNGFYSNTQRPEKSAIFEDSIRLDDDVHAFSREELGDESEEDVDGESSDVVVV